MTDPATDQARLFAARSRNTMPNPIKNKIAQIKTGHHVPVAPETPRSSVATPRTNRNDRQPVPNHAILNSSQGAVDVGSSMRPSHGAVTRASQQMPPDAFLTRCKVGRPRPSPAGFLTAFNRRFRGALPRLSRITATGSGRVRAPRGRLPPAERRRAGRSCCLGLLCVLPARRGDSTTRTHARHREVIG
jgi:hypothetical protein